MDKLMVVYEQMHLPWSSLILKSMMIHHGGNVVYPMQQGLFLFFLWQQLTVGLWPYMNIFLHVPLLLMHRGLKGNLVQQDGVACNQFLRTQGTG